jgi:hypothetical protein
MNEAEADDGVAALGPKGEKLSEFALPMGAGMKLESYFPLAVKDGIHIIVQILDCKSSDWSHPLTEITTDTFLCVVPSAGKRRRQSNNDTADQPDFKRVKRHSAPELIG